MPKVKKPSSTIVDSLLRDLTVARSLATPPQSPVRKKPRSLIVNHQSSTSLNDDVSGGSSPKQDVKKKHKHRKHKKRELEESSGWQKWAAGDLPDDFETVSNPTLPRKPVTPPAADKSSDDDNFSSGSHTEGGTEDSSSDSDDRSGKFSLSDEFTDEEEWEEGASKVPVEQMMPMMPPGIGFMRGRGRGQKGFLIREENKVAPRVDRARSPSVMITRARSRSKEKKLPTSKSHSRSGSSSSRGSRERSRSKHKKKSKKSSKDKRHKHKKRKHHHKSSKKDKHKSDNVKSPQPGCEPDAFQLCKDVVETQVNFVLTGIFDRDLANEDVRLNENRAECESVLVKVESETDVLNYESRTFDVGERHQSEKDLVPCVAKLSNSDAKAGSDIRADTKCASDTQLTASTDEIREDIADRAETEEGELTNSSEDEADKPGIQTDSATTTTEDKKVTTETKADGKKSKKKKKGKGEKSSKRRRRESESTTGRDKKKHKKDERSESTERRHKRSRSTEKSDKKRTKSRSRSRSRERHDRYRRDSYDREARGRGSAFRGAWRGYGRNRYTRSPDRGGGDLREKINKQELLAIARKNAVKMLKRGENVPGLDRLLTKESVLSLKAGGKSVDELTSFCKKLSEREYQDMSDSEDDSADDDDAFRHPFKVTDRGPIVLNIRNSIPLPIRSPAEKAAESVKLRIQFPVSSGTQHRTKESEWVPVSPPRKPDKKAAKVGVPALTAPEKLLALEAPPAISDAMLMPPPPPPGAPVNDVFPDPQQGASIDIGSVVSERLKAVRKLQDNPNDVEAMNQMYFAQKKMSDWAQSKQVPGLFTGSTDAPIMKPEELSGGYQAWAKKGQFMQAPKVAGGMGMFLLRKMGWAPGEGLGKNKEGPVEPLMLEVKNDKKGLISMGEIAVNRVAGGPQNKVRRGPLPKDLSGKHPVSALMELCNKRRWGPPAFDLVFDGGADHRKNFLFKVMVNNVEYQPTVASHNKKMAKCAAATVCLQAMGLVPR